MHPSRLKHLILWLLMLACGEQLEERNTQPQRHGACCVVVSR